MPSLVRASPSPRPSCRMSSAARMPRPFRKEASRATHSSSSARAPPSCPPTYTWSATRERPCQRTSPCSDGNRSVPRRGGSFGCGSRQGVAGSRGLRPGAISEGRAGSTAFPALAQTGLMLFASCFRAPRWHRRNERTPTTVRALTNCRIVSLRSRAALWGQRQRSLDFTIACVRSNAGRHRGNRRRGRLAPARVGSGATFPGRASARDRAFRGRQATAAETGAARWSRITRVTSVSVIGQSVPRLDGREKATGATRYAGDLRLPGMLHARLVLSPHAHARIVAIDSGAAAAQPGVVGVFTGHDLPLVKADPTDRGRCPLAIGRVVFVGHPVAAVVAETEAQAEDAAQLV